MNLVQALNRSSVLRRTVGLLLFLMTGAVYALLAIPVILKSEVIRPADSHVDWTLAERLFAFPAFYLGVDPLTGLIINATVWGLSVAIPVLHVWPRDRAKGRSDRSR